MSDFVVPKLKVPLRVGAKGLECVEQDSDEEVLQCVEAILRTQPGTRPDDPAIGMPDFAFSENGVDPVVVRSILSRYEPRAEVMTDAELVELAETMRVQVLATTEEGTSG